MSTINNIRKILAGLAEGADQSQVVESLSLALPVEVRQKVGRGLLAELISARLSQLHYNARAKEISLEIKEIESNPDDERGVWISSWERDVDRAIDGSEYAEATVESIIEKIARQIAEGAQANHCGEAPRHEEMTAQKRSVRIRQELVLRIPHQMVTEAFLSVPKWSDLNGRGGIVRDRIRACQIAPGKSLPVFDVSNEAKRPYDEHLANLGLKPDDPLLVVGARNLGNNLRVVAYRQGTGVLQLRGEDAHTGGRSYSCICHMTNGRLEPHELSFMGERVSKIDGADVDADTANSIQWALSGQPLLWNGRSDEDAIIRSTYDLRHFYCIPTGEGRFGARGHAGDIVEDLVTVLVNTDDPGLVRQRAKELALGREMNYFHSAIGLSTEGDVVIVQVHGSFELVADKLRAAGATYGIELDEGGSVSAHFVYQQDGQRDIAESRVLASHYFRARASALLILKMVFEPGKKPFIPTEEDAALGLSSAQ